MKPHSREIGYHNDRIALKFDRHLGRTTAEGPVKCQSDWKSLNPNLEMRRPFPIICWRSAHRRKSDPACECISVISTFTLLSIYLHLKKHRIEYKINCVERVWILWSTNFACNVYHYQLWCWNQNIPVEYGLYQVYRGLGSLRRLVISRHGSEYTVCNVNPSSMGNNFIFYLPVSSWFWEIIGNANIIL